MEQPSYELMKRATAILFLSLYAYNFAGYIALFSFLQHRIRTEVKAKIKSSVPADELVLLAFSAEALKDESSSLQWLDDREFRYNGNMYDIVRSYTRADTTFFLCLNDIQEEKLFAHLDAHVQRQMANSGQQEKLDAFKDVFSHSLAARVAPLSEQDACGVVPNLLAEDYVYIYSDTPFHPPRDSST